MFDIDVTVKCLKAGPFYPSVNWSTLCCSMCGCTATYWMFFTLFKSKKGPGLVKAIHLHVLKFFTQFRYKRKIHIQLNTTVFIKYIITAPLTTLEILNMNSEQGKHFSQHPYILDPSYCKISEAVRLGLFRLSKVNLASPTECSSVTFSFGTPSIPSFRIFRLVQL